MLNYKNPCLKPTIEYLSFKDEIYFFHRPGIAVKLKDPSGFIAATCKLIDGNKQFSEIREVLSLDYPQESLYLQKLLNILDKEALLEDKSSNYPINLTNYDLTRWSHNIEFFGAHSKANENKYSKQEKIKATNVVILGLGGVGSNILYNLAALGVGSIKAIDFDQVELSNLNRQIIYNESDIGKFKFEIAREKIRQFNPSINLDFHNKKIGSSADVEDEIQGADFVISAIDHPRENVLDWVNLACVKKEVPFICGSLDSRVVTYFTIIPRQTGCIECWKYSVSESTFTFQKLIQNENFVSSPSPNIAIMPLISLVAGFVTNEFLKIVTGIGIPQSLGALCSFDFLSSQHAITESWEKNPSCSICTITPN